MSILALYVFIWAMIKDKNYFWFLIPLLVILAFLSKQVPSGYVFVIILLVFFNHLFFENKKKIIRIISITFFPACFHYFF